MVYLLPPLQYYVAVVINIHSILFKMIPTTYRVFHKDVRRYFLKLNMLLQATVHRIICVHFT